MNPLSFIGDILGNILGMGRDWLASERKLKEARVEHELAMIKAQTETGLAMAVKAQQGDIDWDIEAQKAAATGWKDEWLTILFSVPLVMAFIPGLDEYVHNGFDVLSETPEWYQIAIAVVVAASFGYRKFIDLVVRK